MNPYIGITDFTNFQQVQKMLKVFEAHKPQGSQRKLHVGVMTSYKTLNGIPSRWQNVFPPKETVASIFSSDEAYNCYHYADYDNNSDFSLSLMRVMNYGGSNLHAVQLDMIWPDPEAIEDSVLCLAKRPEFILQIGRNALDEVGNDSKALVEKLRRYEGRIHRVLLDKSMGRGLGMDAEALIPFARAIRENFPMLGLGAAGGLGPKSIHLVESLVREFSDLSIDAQGQLRPSGNAMDPIDWGMAGEYLIQALRLTSEIPDKIPFGALNALGLGDGKLAKDASPLDWPVEWSIPEQCWRHRHLPIAAVFSESEGWRRIPATY